MNEPNGKGAPAAWNRLAKRLTKVIRDLWAGEKLGWAYYSYREWYAMDLERDPEDRAREGRRTETEAVKVFKRHLAR